MRGISMEAPGKQLLLKSPAHTFRMPRLRVMFPRARFVWIAREPGEVLASNLKMWRMMIDLYALWHCPPGTLENFLDEMLEACARVLARCLDEMHRDKLLWVDFEELRTTPKVTLQRVLAFLDPSLIAHRNDYMLKVDQALARIAIHEGSRSSHPRNERMETLEKLMASARQRFGRAPAT